MVHMPLPGDETRCKRISGKRGEQFVTRAGSKDSEHIRRSTITDVAQMAGVSIKTVSRVVRREPNVSAKMRDAVNDAIAKLNYRPTISARSTTSARSFLLGLVFDNPNPTYTFELLKGAQRGARENGYQLVFEPLERNGKALGATLRQLVIQSNLEGVIVPPPLCDDRDVLNVLSELDRPFARISPSTQPSLGLSVSMDDLTAARAMTEHLIELGHRRIAHIMGRAGTATTRNRLAGYRIALEAAGIAFDAALVRQGNFQLRSGLEQGDILLALGDPPTAIFAANDDMAAGVLMAAHRRGLGVPDDLSVSGFDDAETASAMWPKLTTIRQPIAEMAATAASRIIEYQRRSKARQLEDVQLNFELIDRDSTGRLRESK